MTSATTTTRKTVGYGVRNDVIRDLWNAVREIPGIHKYNFSKDMAMEYLVERMIIYPKKKLCANSVHTFQRVSDDELHEIVMKCHHKEVTYQMMLVAKNDPDKYAIADDMYSDDDLPDEPLEQ
jgi:hypothetical protein